MAGGVVMAGLCLLDGRVVLVPCRALHHEVCRPRALACKDSKGKGLWVCPHTVHSAGTDHPHARVRASSCAGKFVPNKT